jgi:hypothetical protein
VFGLKIIAQSAKRKEKQLTRTHGCPFKVIQIFENLNLVLSD